MMAYGPVTVMEIAREPGRPVTGDDIAAAYGRLQQAGLRPLWPPVHCPIDGRDRFMLAAVASTTATKPGAREAPPSDLGGFQF